MPFITVRAPSPPYRSLVPTASDFKNACARKCAPAPAARRCAAEQTSLLAYWSLWAGETSLVDGDTRCFAMQMSTITCSHLAAMV